MPEIDPAAIRNDIRDLSEEDQRRVAEYVASLQAKAIEGRNLLQSITPNVGGGGGPPGPGNDPPGPVNDPILDDIQDTLDHIRHVKNGFIAVGGIAGVIGGAYLGVGIGAGFGPVGMVVGAGIGGVLGLLGGMAIGSALASLILYIVKKIKHIAISIQTRFGQADVQFTMAP